MMNNFLPQTNQRTKINEFFQFMRANYLWSASRVSVKTYFIQHISQRSFYIDVDIDIASDADDITFY